MSASARRRPGGDLDRGTVVGGAAVALAISLPPTFVARALKGDDAPGQESNLWIVAVVAMLVGFAAAGRWAALRRPDSPLVHSAAAAGLAFAAIVVFTVVRRLVAGEGLTVPLVVTLGLLGQITVSLAVLGGYLAVRRRRSPAA